MTGDKFVILFKEEMRMIPAMSIIKNSNTSLREQKTAFLRDTKGKIREILETIWNGYVLYGEKETCLPLECRCYENQLKELGFICNLSQRNNTNTFVVSWQ